MLRPDKSTWDEIDLEAATWTIPESRMKAGVEHRVPLSEQALDVLRRAAQQRGGSGYVFPAQQSETSPLGDMALTAVLRRAGLQGRCTAHGMRTVFKVWAMETTATPWAVGEAALAHRLGNSVESAYARTDLLEKRRPLMQQWASYVTEGGTA